MKITEAINVRSSVSKVVDFLDALPDDEVISTNDLEQAVGFTVDTGSIRRNAKSYSYRLGLKKYWGNPRAIASLKQQLEEDK